LVCSAIDDPEEIKIQIKEGQWHGDHDDWKFLQSKFESSNEDGEEVQPPGDLWRCALIVARWPKKERSPGYREGSPVFL